MNSDSKIWLSPPHMSGLEMEFINLAFEDNYIAPIGPNIDGFEKDLENYLREESFVSLTNSGTAAIHLALALLGVKKNDEILCQTKTFIASINPITYLGAKPIFIDSEKDTWNICPELLEKAIQDRLSKGIKPKAIIVISLYGMPFKIKEIKAISDFYDIPIIEDSAEALGSSYFERKCGTFGKFSIFSFNGNKIITTSGGGALICKTEQEKLKAINLATQAKDIGVEYNHSQLGYNYRMTNIAAGIGRGQIRVLEDRIQARRTNFDFYNNNLSSIEYIEFQNEPEGFFSNRWLTCIKLTSKEDRNALLDLLKENNIESRPSWKPMHLQPLYDGNLSYLNGNAEELYNLGLCLPSGSNLTENDLERITTLIKSYFEQKNK